MNTKSWIKFSIAIALILFFTISIIVGSDAMEISKVSEMKLGIDIKGGVSATIYPDVEDLSTVDADQLDMAKNILTKRLEAQGTYDATVAVDKENKRILLEIPYSGGESSNPQEVIDSLGKMAQLTFREVDSDAFLNEDTNKYEYAMSDLIIISGSNIDVASAASYENENVVSIELDSDGAKLFGEATARLVGQPIAIYLDDVFISAPSVDEAITSGSMIIRGGFTADEAIELASYIKYGALPFGLVAKEMNAISPILGESALNVTLWAAMVAFALVILFMLYKYRLPGFVATLALCGLVAAEIFWISAFKASITLPGIAGIILTIGMGVDANVIIYERIKEEIKGGLPIDDSIDLGFKRAFSAIIDANVTTLITAIILYSMGSGPIKGFALVLIIGVFMSFFTAIFISKHLLKTFSKIKFFKKKWFYSVKEVS